MTYVRHLLARALLDLFHLCNSVVHGVIVEPVVEEFLRVPPRVQELVLAPIKIASIIAGVHVVSLVGKDNGERLFPVHDPSRRISIETMLQKHRPAAHYKIFAADSEHLNDILIIRGHRDRVAEVSCLSDKVAHLWLWLVNTIFYKCLLAPLLVVRAQLAVISDFQ